MASRIKLSSSPRFQRIEVGGGGVRKLGVSCNLAEQVLEWGTDRSVPLDPPGGIRFLDARVRNDTLEFLVQSPSFEGGGGATWETAEWWNPPFRRIEGGPTV